MPKLNLQPLATTSSSQDIHSSVTVIVTVTPVVQLFLVFLLQIEAVVPVPQVVLKLSLLSPPPTSVLSFVVIALKSHLSYCCNYLLKSKVL